LKNLELLKGKIEKTEADLRDKILTAIKKKNNS